MLEHAIKTSEDPLELSDLIHTYGYNFPVNEEILSRIDFYITKEPTPGLTAVCLEVAIEMWGLDQYEKELVKYIDLNEMELWYDEVIFSVSYFLRHPHLATGTIEKRMGSLKMLATISGRESLIELFKTVKPAASSR